MPFKCMKQLGLALAAVVVSASAMAGTAVGAGVTWTFGGPKPMAGPALGIKLFSTDKEQKGAAYIGVDYSFSDHGLRPNVGLAYLAKHKTYIGADIGYSFTQQGADFGAGLGFVDSKKRD